MRVEEREQVLGQSRRAASGTAASRLEQQLIAGPGDFIYIPPGVPHLVMNGSDSVPTVAVLARNDANEQEDVTELPELDALPHLQLEAHT